MPDGKMYAIVATALIHELGSGNKLHTRILTDKQSLRTYLLGLHTIAGRREGEPGRNEAEATVMKWFQSLDNEEGDTLTCQDLTLSVVKPGGSLSEIAVKMLPVANINTLKPKATAHGQSPQTG